MERERVLRRRSALNVRSEAGPGSERRLEVDLKLSPQLQAGTAIQLQSSNTVSWLVVVLVVLRVAVVHVLWSTIIPIGSTNAASGK